VTRAEDAVLHEALGGLKHLWVSIDCKDSMLLLNTRTPDRGRLAPFALKWTIAAAARL